MNTMTHKGYVAKVEYSEEDACFVGHIAGIRDIVGFHGNSVAGLRAAFVKAVEDYLATCDKLKQSPNRPYSGKFQLRLAPEIHARAAMTAEAEGKSLNTWASDVIQHAAR